MSTETKPATTPDGAADLSHDLALVEAAGMAVEDGFGYTVQCGRLTSGEPAPDWILSLNGEEVEVIAAEIRARKGEREPVA